jgi:hypothetical protein
MVTWRTSTGNVVNSPDSNMYHQSRGEVCLPRPSRSSEVGTPDGDEEPYVVTAKGPVHVEYIYVNLMTHEAHLDDPWQSDEEFTVDLVTGDYEYADTQEANV